MRVIAAISAFLFISLAAMFGSNASSAQTAPWLSALLILVFVAGTSLLMGIISVELRCASQQFLAAWGYLSCGFHFNITQPKNRLFAPQRHFCL
jgi:hypothetical protein